MMTAKAAELLVSQLADTVSRTFDCRVVIETEHKSMLGRDIIELRIFLHTSPYRMAADRWLWLYRRDLAAAVISAGLELAVDDWFVPSQEVPSCSCWITIPRAAAEIARVGRYEGA